MRENNYKINAIKGSKQKHMQKRGVGGYERMRMRREEEKVEGPKE